MHVLEIEIENIRALDRVHWQIDADDAIGWHVILGENGAGKSTFLRSIALALVGPEEAPALRQDWDTWLQHGSKKGRISITLDFDGKRDRFSGRGPRAREYLLPASVAFRRDGTDVHLQPERDDEPSPFRHVWGGKRGWFAASYGPFRRFTGGDSESERLYLKLPRLARHLSVFGESFALSEPIAWLKQLDHERLRNKVSAGLLSNLKKFINQPDFLPNNVRLHQITHKGVEFRDGNKQVIRIEDLSDGYRSLLSMTFELLRQLVACYGPAHIFEGNASRVTAPGVVLIDEVDVHLHPSWQRLIGKWMCTHFPKLQFIVTTHSPLVCQAARTVWRLPRPGTSEVGGMLKDIQLDRVLYGDPVESYESTAFNLHALRSDESSRMLEELAKLNSLELKKKLSPAQVKRHRELRAIFPTAVSSMGKP